MQLYFDQIDWTSFQHLSQQTIQIGSSFLVTPESVCSKPCKPKEYRIQQELPCCWDCRTCHVNEYIINGTLCDECPFGEWPEEQNATYCVTIEKTYLKFDEWIAMFLLGMATLGLIVTIYTSGFYIANRSKKIIKATTRELCSMILTGIFLAYVSVFCYILKPTYLSCLLNRHGFNLAVILIYAPLFVKTNRVFRIFKATQRGIGKARFIDTTTQIILSVTFILVQVNACSINKASKTQTKHNIQVIIVATFGEYLLLQICLNAPLIHCRLVSVLSVKFWIPLKLRKTCQLKQNHILSFTVSWS